MRPRHQTGNVTLNKVLCVLVLLLHPRVDGASDYHAASPPIELACKRLRFFFHKLRTEEAWRRPTIPHYRYVLQKHAIGRAVSCNQGYYHLDGEAIQLTAVLVFSYFINKKHSSSHEQTRQYLRGGDIIVNQNPRWTPIPYISLYIPLCRTHCIWS